MQLTKNPDTDDNRTRQTANRVEYRTEYGRDDGGDGDTGGDGHHRDVEGRLHRRLAQGVVPSHPPGDATRRSVPSESAGWRAVVRANDAADGATHEYDRRLHYGDPDEAEGGLR